MGLGVDLFIRVSEYGPFAECPKGLKWGPGRETAAHWAWAAVGAAWPRGACGPVAPTALEVSEEMGCCLEP